VCIVRDEKFQSADSRSKYSTHRSWGQFGTEPSTLCGRRTMRVELNVRSVPRTLVRSPDIGRFKTRLELSRGVSLLLYCVDGLYWVLCTEVRYVRCCDRNTSSWRCSCFVRRLCVLYMCVFLIVIWPMLLYKYVHFIIIVTYVLVGLDLVSPTRIDCTAVSCSNSRWRNNSVSPRFLHLEISLGRFATLRDHRDLKEWEDF
jgi:hypothetical protein